MCFAHVSPVRHALTSSGLAVVNAPFREFVVFLSIQTFLCGGSKLPFGSETIQGRQLVLAQFERTLVWTGQGYVFATLQYMRWAPCWIRLKPEDLQKQVGKLAEKYDALVVIVTLRDGFGVPQVKL